MALDRLVWQRDRVLLDDLVFRLELEKQEEKDARWELGEDCFGLYKLKWILDNYARFWASRPDFRPQNVFEIGIWDGGSLALWFEQFHPRKLVGIDIGLHQIDGRIVERAYDSEYFKRYVASRGLQDRIRTFWKVDQADRERLRQIVAQEFEGPLDLVIDDGSHQYAHSKAAFETLFPRLRRGGLYIIEDWAWSHWGGYEDPAHAWAEELPLTRLVQELTEINGSPERFLRGKGSLSVLRTLIATVTITPDFAVFERGDVLADELPDFALEKYVLQRPQDDPRTVEQRYENLRAQNDDLKTKIAHLEGTKEYDQKWLHELEAGHAELHKYYLELEANHKELETSHQDLHRFYQELDAGQQELQGAYDELAAGQQELQGAYDELAGNHQDSLQQFGELQTAYEEQAARHAELDQSFLELQTKHSRLESSHQEFQASHQALLASYDELLTSHEQLQNRHEELNAGHEKLLTEYQELEAVYYDLDQRHVPLTYFSGLLRATLRAGWGKFKRALPWSGS